MIFLRRFSCSLLSLLLLLTSAGHSQEPPAQSAPEVGAEKSLNEPDQNDVTSDVEATDSADDQDLDAETNLIEEEEPDDLELDDTDDELIEDDTTPPDEEAEAKELTPAPAEDLNEAEEPLLDEEPTPLLDDNVNAQEQEEPEVSEPAPPLDEDLTTDEDDDLLLDEDDDDAVMTQDMPAESGDDLDELTAEPSPTPATQTETEEGTLLTVNPLTEEDEDLDLDLDDDDEDDISDEDLGEDVDLLDADDPDDAEATARLFADDEELEDDESGADTSAFDDVEADDENDEFDNEAFFNDDDDLDEDEESGSHDPKKGAKITHPLFGELIFGPAPEFVKDGSAQPIGTATTRALDLSKPNESSDVSHGVMSSSVGAVITKPELYVTQKGNLALKGIFIANNIRGKISLKSMSDGEMLFDVSFPRPFRIQISPDRAVNIQNFKLSISESGDVEFFARKFVFKKKPQDYDPEDEEEDTTITFGITTQDGEGNATTEELPLYILMKEAKGNKDLEKIMLEELVFTIANPFSSKPPPPRITVECTARLDHIKLWGKAHLSNSTCEISMDHNSVELTSEGDTPIIFDDAMTLESPLVEIEVSKGERPEFTIGGTLACNFPVIGRMKLPIQGEKRDDGITLKGKIQKEIGFGPIKFGNPELVVETSDGSAADDDDPTDDAGDAASKGTNPKPQRQRKVEIMGTGKFFGFKIKPTMRMVKPADGSKRKVSFSAKFDAPNLNPFGFIPGLKSIPGLGDLKIPDAFLGMSSAKKFFIGGSVKALGIVGKLKLVPKSKIMEIASEQPWRLSDTIPGAKGTIFDTVILNNIRFAAAAKEGYDDETDTPISKGLNAFGTLDTSQGMFANLRKMMGGALPKSVTASIVLSANPRHCKYVIMLPFDVKLSSKAILHGISFEISGEPSVALMLTLKFLPSASDPPLLFTARVEFEVIGCALSATMAGFWHHPFGIKGVHVGDLAIEAKLPYAIPPIPIAFGLAGTIQVGEFLLKVAVKMGADDIILLAEISKLPLFFWIDLIKMVGMDLGPLDILKAIDIYLEDVKFKFAPTGGQIGTLMFEPGISGQGRLKVKVPGIIDTFAEAGFNLNVPNGFKLYAYMPTLELGPLKITGKGPDTKYGTKDDGAILRVVLGLLEQRIFLSAQAELLGAKGEAEVDIKLTSVRFKMLMKFLDLIESKIIGESYRKGARIGFRVMSLFRLGRSKMKMVGDLSTYGYTMASRLDSLTIKDIAATIGIPEDVIPDIGFKDVESYIRFMPGQMIEDAVKPSVQRITKGIKEDIDELRGMRDEIKKDLAEAAANIEKDVQEAAVKVQEEAARIEAEQAAQQAQRASSSAAAAAA